MKCTKGIKDCKCENFSPWLPDGTSLKDFIQWKELWFMLIFITVCVLSMGLFGLVVFYAIDTLTRANGGNIFRYNAPEPNIKHTESEECLKGKHTYCKII